MRCTVITHKKCWVSARGASTYATTGGFPIQIEALADLFDGTRLVVPLLPPGPRPGQRVLRGRNLTVVPLTVPPTPGPRRLFASIGWIIRNGATLVREVRRAEAVHTLIPGDVGTVGTLLALIMRKPLFVRHCGNWFVPETSADGLMRWVMRRFAGGRNVMLATGGGAHPPSSNGRPIHWTFSTSLSGEELAGRARRADPTVRRRGRLIVVCRQEARKGTATVIESLALILRRFPEATLDVVGTGSQLATLQRLAQSLGLQGRVTFHGQVSHAEVMRLLGEAEVFCYPTNGSEGFSKAVLEALASGLPVIVPPVSVMPVLLETGSGVLLPDITPAAVAEAVDDVLSHPSRYHAMSVQAVQTARRYSLERWRTDLAEVLQGAWGPLRDGA